jgi:hypothetical protein
MSSENFDSELQLGKTGRNFTYKKGLDHLKQYPFLQNLTHREIQARALDLNYTIQTTNHFLLGVYSPFNRSAEMPFEIGAPNVLPPEPLSFDPKDIIGFKTPLPYGLQFIPVLSTSSKHHLKLMLADGSCPDWKGEAQKRLQRADDRLKSNPFFEASLKKIYEKIGIEESLISSKK